MATLGPTVLFDIQDAIRDVIKVIADDGTPIFGTSPDERVWFQGDAIDTTKLAAVTIVFTEETSVEKSTVFRHRLPWRARVYFDADFPGSSTRDRHTKALGLLRDAVMADNTLGGKAIETSYLGGGSALSPEDEEESGDRWSFEAQFETQYGDEILDSTTAG